MSVPVLAMPMFDPGQGRISLTLPEGLTIDAIVQVALGKIGESQRGRLRVVLADGHGSASVIPEVHWRRVRPRPGVHVIIRLVPAGDGLRSVLMIAVSIAAVALGQFWAPSIVGALGLTGSLATMVPGVLTAGIAALGGLLVNALIPVRTNAQDAEKPSYSISGWRNTANPSGIIPCALGRHRMAPVFLAGSYTEIVGDDQYVRAMLGFGYGPLAISDIRIGETPIGNFNDVQMELRQGFADDTPCTLYPQQVIEEALGVELLRNYPRDGNGNAIGGFFSPPGPEDPVQRYSASDITEAAVILGFPAGMVEFDDEGNEKQLSVSIRIRQRPIGGAWSTVTTLNFSSNKREPFFRTYRWRLPARGKYEIELTRISPESLNSSRSDRVVWVALQGFRPEYPINFDKPLALLALRIRATHQLNGSLDTVNAIVSRIAPDWDAETGTWIERETRSPASAMRFVLQGPAATFPEPDAGVSLAQLQDFHEFCVSRDLKYDRLHDFESSQWDVLGDVAAAGRATPRHDGRRWGVVIDRAGEPVIDHIHSGNSHSFAWSRTYFQPPDAMRVTFLDATNDYRSMERIIPFPGATGDIEITEQLQLPGKTDPDEIWIETRRRMYELLHRPDRFTAIQSGMARRVTRGDRVKGSFETLEHTQTVQRARRVAGNLIELAGPVAMEAGEDYACRYRVFDEDGGMQSVLRRVVTYPGETNAIQVTGAGPMPEADEWVQFGIAGNESIDLIVTGIEAGDDQTSIISAVAEASIIDELVDAEVPPAWDGRVGGAIDDDTTAPPPPIVRNVGLTSDGFAVLLDPGAGSAVMVSTFAIRHRLAGNIGWSGPAIGAAGAGAIVVTGYDGADEVEWEAQAISRALIGSDFTDTETAIIPVPVGVPDPIPSASATAGLGSASLLISTPADARLATIQIYRGPTDDIEDGSLIAALGVLASSTYGHVDGDGARTSIVLNGAFSADTDWTKGTDWAIAGGKATKAAGAATSLSQALAITAGKTYRYRLTVSGFAAGTLTPALTGGADASGTMLAGDGVALGAIVALSGNDTLAFQADAAFDGSIDSLVLFEASATSIGQGTHYYFITTANAEGDESAPFTLGPVIIV